MDIQPPKVSVIRELWLRIQAFILPEEVISLKVVFDNVRNYFICTTVVAAVLAIGQEGVPSPSGTSNTAIWPWSLQFVGLMLLGGNALQSWLIISRVTKGIGRLPKTIRPTWGKWRRRTMRLLLVLLVAPFVFAAYQVFPTLIAWAIAGGGSGKAL